MSAICRIAAASLLCLLAACASDPLRDVPLQWKPTADTNFNLDLAQFKDVRVQMLPFRDASRQPGLIGENRRDATPKPVTTADDVGAFAGKQLRHLFEANGIDVVDGDGDVTISGEVEQFFVVETSTYDGKVQLHLTLRNRAGETLWSGSASGSARRFGLTYSLDNYYKALSDALINGTSTLLQDGEFRGALLGQKQ
jgi:hypothetical protein